MSIHEDIVGLIARTIHDNYYAIQLSRGETGPAVVPWDQLTQDKRDANLAQAGDIGRKLSLIKATVAPLVGPVEPFDFTSAELVQLAEVEHDRWVAERKSQGFRYGPVRDDAKKIHNSMKPYAELSPAEQQKDIDAISGIPKLLADVGLRIVRL
ncbi:hypothetical protein F4553_006040 [Allocatelliglobosispora scoriae]|uniref:Ryanodine receptor Ryr domain-containing protein n=1 Tax=Allocatelliglobosispora scoriae TaxID=643052 RepID=A0A841BYH3_9ACTN|nr:RyR domain-containing protein [Allocatelliglobosispora scoriae]MBB5872606.1 hypothetical protein [Allocatelliglobosispora scoriae]